MTVGELKEALKSRGLKVTGVKSELQQRLSEACSSPPSPSSSTSTSDVRAVALASEDDEVIIFIIIIGYPNTLVFVR